MLQVPLQPVPSQVVNCILGDQSVTLHLRQLATGLYLDVQVGGEEVLGLVVCQNLNPMIRGAYLGFAGELVFVDSDTAAPQDPYFTGLGSRFSLVYVGVDELPPGAG